jgi:NAD(P)-dependent dehydrogenase (short-subunit alcohol dehydrogenase family)
MSQQTLQQTTQADEQPVTRVALVTGAARRLGRAIALALARDGWDIALHFHTSEQAAQTVVAEILALGRRVVALKCDLADEAAVKMLLRRAVTALGPVTCVVNNANLAAPILLAQSLHAATPQGQQAVVINLLDQKLYNLNPDFLSYTLSKAALHTATTLLAQALAPKVRVVGIAPGITLVSGTQSEAEFQQAHQATPLGRSSTPDDVADSVCYVASARALTGTTLLVDGGQHLIPLRRDVMFTS